MATQAEDRSYEVLVWDYDAAPDGQGYYLWKRHCGLSLRSALSRAYCAVEDPPYAVGAAVFRNGEEVRGFGLTFAYQERRVIE